MTDVPPNDREPYGSVLKLESARAPRTPPRFQLVPFNHIQLSAGRRYLIKGLVPGAGLLVAWGPPKCGKSFVIFDMAMHIALGWEYRGRRVQQGIVVYLALEGAEGFRARVEAFRQKRLTGNCIDVPFHLVSVPINLVADKAALIASIRHALGGEAPAMVVVDTLSRSLIGSESDDKDMAAYVRAADAVRETFSCVVAVIHHCGVDASRPRGHTSLTGAADAQLAVKLNAADEIIVSVEWMKDGPAGDVFASRLQQVDVGIDEDGDSITSCVVEALNGAVSQPYKKSGPKLTNGAKIALAALHEAIGEVGEIPLTSKHIPPAVRIVSVDQWKNYAYRQGVSGSEDPRARRQAFQRAYETLVAAKQVFVWAPHVWPA